MASGVNISLSNINKFADTSIELSLHLLVGFMIHVLDGFFLNSSTNKL